MPAPVTPVGVVSPQELCHLHADRSLVQQKTAAIIGCFIDSPIPPALQVDITTDMADAIVEHKLDASPYLFREAQVREPGWYRGRGVLPASHPMTAITCEDGAVESRGTSGVNLDDHFRQNYLNI